jgi:hypothetical protein
VGGFFHCDQFRLVLLCDFGQVLLNLRLEARVMLPAQEGLQGVPEEFIGFEERNSQVLPDRARLRGCVLMRFRGEAMEVKIKS